MVDLFITCIIEHVAKKAEGQTFKNSYLKQFLETSNRILHGPMNKISFHTDLSKKIPDINREGPDKLVLKDPSATKLMAFVHHLSIRESPWYYDSSQFATFSEVAYSCSQEVAGQQQLAVHLELRQSSWRASVGKPEYILDANLVLTLVCSIEH